MLTAYNSTLAYVLYFSYWILSFIQRMVALSKRSCQLVITSTSDYSKNADIWIESFHLKEYLEGVVIFPIDAIGNMPDIVIVYGVHTRRDLKRIPDHLGNNYIRCPKKRGIMKDAGVVVFSRKPCVKVHFEPFTATFGMDKTKFSGMLVASYRWQNGRMVTFVITEMLSNPDDFSVFPEYYRQTLDLNALIGRVVPTSEVIILAGEFNAVGFVGSAGRRMKALSEAVRDHGMEYIHFNKTKGVYAKGASDHQVIENKGSPLLSCKIKIS